MLETSCLRTSVFQPFSCFSSAQKTADSLVLKQEEISVQAMQGEKSYGCVIERIEPSADTTAVVCVISNQTGLSIDTLKVP